MENLKNAMSFCGCDDHVLKVPFITLISCYEIENEPPLVLTINSGPSEDDTYSSGSNSDSDSENSSGSSFIGVEIGYISESELAELESVLSEDSDQLEPVNVVFLNVPDPSLEWDEVLYYEYDPADEFSEFESMNDPINILDISLDKLQEFSDIVSMDQEINILDTTLHTVDVPDPNLRVDDLLYYEYDVAEELSDIVSMNEEINNIMNTSLDKLPDSHRIRCLRDVSGPIIHS